MAEPLISFGVTTYKRKEMLKECLASILQQTCPDFEVIVGNDYTSEVITNESLGLLDSRIRIINHPHNLGEIDNMNYLLSEAKGRYFSWLADDDLIMPQFIEAMKAALARFSYPKCVFCSYDEGGAYDPGPAIDIGNNLHLMNGSEFLLQYLSRKLKVIGCYGGFETEYLREIGGIKALGDGFSPYADNLLAIRAGLLEKVAYVSAPLIYYRLHDQSLSLVSPDLSAFTSAQEELLSKCEEILLDKKLSASYSRNMYHLLSWCAGTIYEVSRRNASFLPEGAVKYLLALEARARRTGRFYFGFLYVNFKLSARYLINWMRNK